MSRLEDIERQEYEYGRIDQKDRRWLLERVGELEAENQRLREEAEGLHRMIQQAIHPPS